MTIRLRTNDLPEHLRQLAAAAVPVRLTRGASKSVTYLPAVRAFCRSAGLPEPQPEFRFDDVRRWRFDFGFPGKLAALEIDGVTAAGGRHQRIAGYTADKEKLAEALCRGWRVLCVTPAQLRSGVAFQWLERLLRA